VQLSGSADDIEDARFFVFELCLQFGAMAADFADFPFLSLEEAVFFLGNLLVFLKLLPVLIQFADKPPAC